MESVLKENDRLLKHALSVDIVNIIVNDCMNVNCLTMDACEQCITTESELKTDFIKKENYEMLLKQYHTIEKHCISLELNNQLNTEIFQRDNVSSSESAPTFAELFETNELKAQIQEKDIVILKLKEKIKSLHANDKERKEESKVEDIETQNLELDHRVTKLTAENNHLKQTYKQLQVNLKSVEVADLNASLQEKVLVITALKEQLKDKAVLSKAVSLNPIDPALLQVDVVPLVPKLRKNRTAHIDYLKHTLEEAATLRELVESERLLSPLNTPLAYACKYTRRIQELLMILQQTCPRITDLGTTLVATSTVGSPELKATFDTIIEAFLFLDKNGDGKLNKKDMLKAMNEDFPMEKSPTHITKTRFKEMDWNKDGKVSFREFLFSLINWVGLESTDEVPETAF
nr:probable calcium-binding protein CML22 [Tanacetum cinerariifolium]